ncbi:MAG: NUDIX hydrolase, partial [Candidatus Paceibacterota bacterium]
DIECAKREVLEETGIPPENYESSPDYYVTEVHVGSNGIKYAHRYYVGKCIPDITCYIDPFNKYQLGEIRKIGWFTIEQALSMIRPYHIEKKKVLLRVHRKITGRVMVVDFNKNNQPITMDRAPIPVDWKE